MAAVRQVMGAPRFGQKAASWIEWRVGWQQADGCALIVKLRKNAWHLSPSYYGNYGAAAWTCLVLGAHFTLTLFAPTSFET
jgi:hypothetical protein